jgi:AcrR family transcriptional regulator
MTRKVKDDGRTTRWDAHRDARRIEFVEAAVRAIDAHGPDASVADIAAEAGISKPVIYRYFADKSELHEAVGQWGAELVLERMVPALGARESVRDRVAHACDAYFETIEEHPQVFLLLVRHRTDNNDPLADGKTAIAAMLARLIGDNLRRANVDAAGAEPWAEGVVGLGLSIGEWWLTRQTMSREAVAGYLTEFVWHAFDGISTEYGIPQRHAPRDPTVAAITRAQP